MADRPVIILDYDGTLHDSVRIYEPAFRTVMQEITDRGWIEQETYTSEGIIRWIGYSAREMWQCFHPELSDMQRSYAGRRIGEEMKRLAEDGKARLYPGAEEVLAGLHKDYKMYFLSNCMSDYAETHRRAFGLDRWFDRYYCTGDYGFKQKEEVFAEHIYEPGLSYIAVGDRSKDITLAAQCGLRAIGCLYGFGSAEELKGADILIRDIAELPEAVAELEEKSIAEPDTESAKRHAEKPVFLDRPAKK